MRAGSVHWGRRYDPRMRAKHLSDEAVGRPVRHGDSSPGRVTRTSSAAARAGRKANMPAEHRHGSLELVVAIWQRFGRRPLRTRSGSRRLVPRAGPRRSGSARYRCPIRARQPSPREWRDCPFRTPHRGPTRQDGSPNARRTPLRRPRSFARSEGNRRRSRSPVTER